MFKTWFDKRCRRENWIKREIKGNGGIHYEYRVSSLSEDIQIAYAKRLNLSLEALQSTLKPPLKTDPNSLLKL
jgi:hypothetical protein